MAGVPNSQEHLLSSGSGSNINYQTSSLEAAELQHSLVPSSLNILNMSECSSHITGDTSGHSNSQVYYTREGSSSNSICHYLVEEYNYSCMLMIVTDLYVQPLWLSHCCTLCTCT